MFIENGGKVEGREVFTYDPATGNVKKHKSMREACKFLELGKECRSTIYRYADTGKTYKGYLIGFKRPTMAQKMAAYLERWDNLKGLPPEEWRVYEDLFLVSNWGRVKVLETGKMIIPNLSTEATKNLVKYKWKAHFLNRIIAQCFILNRKIRDDESVIRISGLSYECFPHCFKVINRKEQARSSAANARRKNKKPCVKIDRFGNEIEYYDSQSEGAKANGIDRATFNTMVKTGQTTPQGNWFKNLKF